MSKLTITDSIEILSTSKGLKDPAYISEPAYSGDKRSQISFNSNILQINQKKYAAGYVTVYKSENVSKLDFDNNKPSVEKTGLKAGCSQRADALYLGKVKNKHIWIAKKGTRPSFLTKTPVVPSNKVDSEVTYTFELYNDTYTKITPSIKSYLGSIDQSASSSYSLLPTTGFFICVNAAGGGGGRGHSANGILWHYAWNEGGGGAGGAWVFLKVDVNKASLKIKLGKRGRKGTSSGGSTAGDNTYIYLNNNHILTLQGGGRGYGKQSDGVAQGGQCVVGSYMSGYSLSSEAFNQKLYQDFGAGIVICGSGGDGTGETTVKKSAYNFNTSMLL